MPAPPPLELTTIWTVSPSLAELLRLCPLRAGLSRLENATALVLGNPKAWLGTAYHEVLAAAGAHASDASAADVWEQAVREQHERAEAHPLNRRFGVPDRWPGYHLIRAMALMRAHEIGGDGGAEVANAGMPPVVGDSRPTNRHERWLTAAGGRLVGRPDLLRGDAVIDYKTGDVIEHREDHVVKATYVRQLQLYAFLVRDSTGRWPARGVLLPMEGLPVEIEFDAGDCERVAAETLELLDKYNDAVSGGAGVLDLASPSPETCRWCPFQLVCPAFWAAAGSSWREHLGTAAVGGLASSVPEPIHSGSALALQLRVDEGTEEAGDVAALSPLSPATYPVLRQVQQGTRIRVVGLARRAGGTLMPTNRTVIARVDDLPQIVSTAP
ncbi:MAG TPA: PD-(D/E)XK nuclease family protein [Egibacteraceae bacterium]|jgi:hypothetical protein|nr:PD-(D/E)XK nuclease family protein [Egibacteraceae bacterium]